MAFYCQYYKNDPINSRKPESRPIETGPPLLHVCRILLEFQNFYRTYGQYGHHNAPEDLCCPPSLAALDGMADGQTEAPVASPSYTLLQPLL